MAVSADMNFSNYEIAQEARRSISPLVALVVTFAQLSFLRTVGDVWRADTLPQQHESDDENNWNTHQPKKDRH